MTDYVSQGNNNSNNLGFAIRNNGSKMTKQKILQL